MGEIFYLDRMRRLRESGRANDADISRETDRAVWQAIGFYALVTLGPSLFVLALIIAFILMIGIALF